MKKSLILIASLLLSNWSLAQWKGKEYVVEKDPKVQQKLEDWQDLKLGFFVHWGAYSVEGLCESWPVVSEDVDWLTPHEDLNAFRKHYFDLPKRFNPTKFDPTQWAELAEDMGAKYFVFTTKHHDGFTMWDTKQTDYKITNPEYPYANAEHADITKSLFDAMRDKGMMIGAYLSKPDWHHPYYWSKSFQSPGRNVNYKIDRHPDWWKNFTDFYFNQVEELMTGYGDIDILWLDGAWADKNNLQQDMKMDDVGEMCREHQPGILVVDRWVGGRWENYRTPEQHIPSESNPIPWETNLTVNCCFSYRFEESVETNVKSGRELTHKFIDIVSKGGNLLLNLGASPEGWFNAEEIKSVKQLGEWIHANEKAIYGTRAIAPFAEANVRYAKEKEGDKVYAYVLLQEGENMNKAMLPGCLVAKGAKIKDIATGKYVKYSLQGNSTLIDMPKKSGVAQYAIAFEISKVEKMAGKNVGKDQAAIDAENRNL
ncbi:alpha-L-fucosidase [Flammeovirga sp. MY04]|uniref:alpha-L-fucosidase n=1 Tax=Flammeovirga sp. MY04 TaxID=1191459 RepID=UPI0008060CDC|nr:alpha-L-fucosidase [Flammeovirga sp. MY04]ANQ51960.1 alpha-L-fucosidase [Flammeovirga sp. MY04]